MPTNCSEPRMNLSSRPPLQIGERQELSTDADFAPTGNGVLSCFPFTDDQDITQRSDGLILSTPSVSSISACRLPCSLQWTR